MSVSVPAKGQARCNAKSPTGFHSAAVSSKDDPLITDTFKSWVKDVRDLIEENLELIATFHGRLLPMIAEGIVTGSSLDRPPSSR